MHTPVRLTGARETGEKLMARAGRGLEIDCRVKANFATVAIIISGARACARVTCAKHRGEIVLLLPLIDELCLWFDFADLKEGCLCWIFSSLTLCYVQKLQRHATEKRLVTFRPISGNIVCHCCFIIILIGKIFQNVTFRFFGGFLLLPICLISVHSH